jgi:hypothetical protein
MQWWVVSDVELRNMMYCAIASIHLLPLLLDFGSDTCLGSLVIMIPALPTGELLNFGTRPLRIRSITTLDLARISCFIRAFDNTCFFFLAVLGTVARALAPFLWGVFLGLVHLGALGWDTFIVAVVAGLFCSDFLHGASLGREFGTRIPSSWSWQWLDRRA